MHPGEWIVRLCLFLMAVSLIRYRTESHEHRLDEGDVLVVIGPNEEINRIRRDMAP